MQYLLDTNVLSDLLRDPAGRVTKRIRHVGINSVCTSIIVSAELHFGLLRKPNAAMAERLNAMLHQIAVLPFDTPAELRYAEVRFALEQTGRLIGPNDMLIAAHALALDATLVTANLSEFARVPGLAVENWLA